MKTPYPHQNANIERALASFDGQGPRWLFANETGIGKTGEALTALKRLEWKGPILVVSEAIARSHWRNEFASWWPERFEDPAAVGIVDRSPNRKTQSKAKLAAWPGILAAPARIVSYDLVDPARDVRPGQAVIFDEIHLLTNPGAKRSQNMRALMRDNWLPGFGLTATPQPDRPPQIWNLLSLLWPIRFGPNPRRGDPKMGFKFLERYMEQLYGEYGTGWGKLRDDNADELRWRLSLLMSRTTRQEIAHLLPPVQVVPLPQPAARNRDDLVVEWANTRAGEVSHLVVLVHKRKRAAGLAELLALKFPDHMVTKVTGALLPEARNVKLAELKAAPKGILVATMHSVTRGISLSWIQRGLFAELYWRPETLIQMVGRFSRLDLVGGAPLLEVLCQDGSLEQRQCAAIAEKLAQIHKTTPAGQTDSALRTAMLPDEKQMEQMLLDAAWQPDWVCDIDSTLDEEEGDTDGD